MSILHRLTERVWCIEHLGVADTPCPVDPVPVCDGGDGHLSEPCRFVPLYIEEADHA